MLWSQCNALKYHVCVVHFVVVNTLGGGGGEVRVGVGAGGLAVVNTQGFLYTFSTVILGRQHQNVVEDDTQFLPFGCNIPWTV